MFIPTLGHLSDSDIHMCICICVEHMHNMIIYCTHQCETPCIIFYNMYTPLYMMHINKYYHRFGFGCFSKHFLQFSNAERNISPSHPQVPMIMPSFVRRMVPIWGPCPKLHGNHAAAALKATPNGSVPKWSLNASQRHENLWPLGNRNKYRGEHRQNRLMNLGKH